MSGSLVACVDVGSTFTKGALVDLERGALLATAEVVTTIDSDVLDGVEVVRARLGERAPGGERARVLACSSAGGGLRLAVVGYERVVSARAGYQVGLSAGARVVHVASGRLDAAGGAALRAATPDVVLLVGGTDGGNADVLLANARALARGGPAVPVVVAGNAAAAEQVRRVLAGRRRAVVTGNVLPRIGELVPGPARAAIREMFIRHVIGGKRLSRGRRFARLVRAATPDAVLAGIELLADGAGAVPGAGEVVVVDVGGATTDVYSVLDPGELPAARRHAAGTLWRSRSVEGDLGVRWNAPGIVEAASAERLLDEGERERLAPAAARRAREPGFVPASGPEGDAERATDARLAQLAVTVALRRHARAGRDLRHVGLVIASGGVFRHADPLAAAAMIAPVTTDLAGGWSLPERARALVDVHYVLAAAGLLAGEHPEAAARLLRAGLPGSGRAQAPTGAGPG